MFNILLCFFCSKVFLQYQPPSRKLSAREAIEEKELGIITKSRDHVSIKNNYLIVMEYACTPYIGLNQFIKWRTANPPNKVHISIKNRIGSFLASKVVLLTP